MRSSHIMAPDQQLTALASGHLSRRPYMPYGFQLASKGYLLGFAAEPGLSLHHCYLLGNGKRAYDTVLMRFYSPDTLSPFARGGINAYAYCKGDPVNNVDRDGHSPTRIVSQGAGLVWGTVGMLSSLNKASRTIVKRSVAKAKGLPVPGEFDAASRTNNAMIFNGGFAATLSKVPGVAMAYAFPSASLASEALNVVAMGGAAIAGVGKLRQLFSDMRSTYLKAKLNRLPLRQLGLESVKEATGWNRLRGRESAILEPIAEQVLLVRMAAGSVPP
ncbi:RHS repeat-associated core domain-containing protein [Pseudomonas sp. NPDC090592]|uniref:RHS repeat-associated core domain-containing protein n=1 Tax=Pseudomonas sp. NPDC090592 TaxID=3364480 RepID=UPI00383B451A